MTTQQLTFGRHHLADNRRLVIGRSLASAVAGIIPIPVFDDWLSSRVRRGTIRRIAVMRGVDLNDDAVIAIADGKSDPPSLSSIAGLTLAYRVLSKSWRKVLITYIATERARHAAHSFSVATLFDHYCARLHVGLGLDGATGMRLRELIDASLDDTSGTLAAAMFKRGILAAAKATARAPVELLDLATGGRVRKLLTRGDENVVVAEVDDAIERSMEGEHGFLARAANAVEFQLSTEQNPYLDELITRFESAWRQQERDDE